MSNKPLPVEQLYRSSQLAALGDDCKSTKQITPLNEIIGQARAKQAVEFAMSIKDKGYNIYALGRNGLGKRTMVMRYLNRHEPNGTPLYDWCYVADFDEPRSPKVLTLPAGKGLKFKKDIEKLLGRLMKALPLAFDNEIYYSRSEKLKNQLSKKEESALLELTNEAKSKSVSLSMTPHGDYQLVAMKNEEEPHDEASFSELSKDEQRSFENTIIELEKQLRGIVRKLATYEEEFSDKVQELNQEIALEVIDHVVKELKANYKGHKQVLKHLELMQKDMLDNLDIFLEDSEDQTALAYAALEKKMPRRYQVNVMVSQGEDKFPVEVNDSPTYHSVFGYVENATYKGTVFTDFSLIRAGSLHRANGGVLLMDAIKVLERPYLWDGLKKALRSRKLNVSSLEKEVTLSGTISLEPQDIPLDVKIILFGDYHTYQLLQHYDPEFSELFRVTAEFEDEMPRDKQSELQYSEFISSIVHDNKMLHCDRKAIARVIEYSSRRAGDQNKVSLHSAEIANLLRETNYIAKASNAKMIRVSHVEQALENQEMRSGRLKDNVLETFSNGTTLLATMGTAVGQVNGLSVISTCDCQFGMPNRITATTAFGDGEIFDIERDVKLSGNIHAKGVKILSAYLAEKLGKTSTIPLKTHLTFEQSYGMVDGDSASLAELCAILSAYSGLKVRQDIAITGSMNQFGEAQPIGGVNEKIEGFFDVCMIKGRDEQQGVIIPKSNVHNLMLRKDIIKAVSEGSFSIWAVSHVSEAIELLMGIEAGEVDSSGHYPHHSVFGAAQFKLNAVK